jgi:hypothetical protein
VIRKTYRRSPSVESLESMVLLSGFSTATHHAAPALLSKLPAASTVTNASGTLAGTITVGPGFDSRNSFDGSGVISPFGRMKVKGSYAVSGPNYQQTGTFTLTTPKGSIVVDTIEFGNGPVSMTVTKGTKHFKGIAGSGSGSLSSFANLKLGMKTKGHFTLTVNLNATTPTS